MLYNCYSCCGSGLYRGLCEPQGCAVVCLTCKGHGGIENLSNFYKKVPFAGIVKRSDIQRVYRSGGRMIGFGAGPKGEYISYQDFLNGKLP